MATTDVERDARGVEYQRELYYAVIVVSFTA